MAALGRRCPGAEARTPEPSARRRLPLRLLIGGDRSISSISRRGEGGETPAATASGILSSLPARPRTFAASSPVSARRRLRPLLLAPSPAKWRARPPGKPRRVRTGSGRPGPDPPGSRRTVPAPEALRSPRPSRQDASYLVPREERGFVQDGPAGLGGRRRRGALHAALPEPEQPLRLLRGAGRLLSLHELAGGGGRRGRR